MILETENSQMLIIKLESVIDIIKLRSSKVEIYYKRKLLPKNFDDDCRKTLIDYAALCFIKKSNLMVGTSLISIKQSDYKNKKSDPEDIYKFLPSLAQNFGYDLKGLLKNMKYNEIILANLFARRLIARSSFVGGDLTNLGIELMNMLDNFKEIIDKIEWSITSEMEKEK